MPTAAIVRDVASGDASAIATIYNYYIANTTVTFEEAEVSAQQFAARITEATALGMPYLVAEVNNAVVGFAYASKWKGRCAYRYSVEVTVYLAADRAGAGLGSLLYAALFEQLKALGYHTVIGGISLPNPASIALHEKFTMQKVAHFKEVGFKFGQWVDVGYWQGTL